MRILVINPPLLVKTRQTACEQDRLSNLRDLQRLGHEVRVITRATGGCSVEETSQSYREQGVAARVLPLRYPRLALHRLTDIAYLDGSAWALGAPDFGDAVEREISEWRPELAWMHATYAWPALPIARKHGLPSVIRSTNYEAVHFLQETGSKNNLVARLRYIGKQTGEHRAVDLSSVLSAITPAEQGLYQSLNKSACVETLPLRALPYLIAQQPVFHERDPIHLFFMGASYNISHNQAALNFIVTQLLPKLRVAAPGRFVIHITGAKPPAAVRERQAEDLIFHDYVADLSGFLAGMDAALAPSLQGTGMQQKVFEPICRGFPTITHPRALAGYAFTAGTDILLAEDVPGYVAQLNKLLDPDFRRSIGQNGLAQAKRLFGRDIMDAKVNDIIAKALQKRPRV